MKDILQFKHVSLQRQPVLRPIYTLRPPCIVYKHLISLYLDLDIIKIDLLLRPLLSVSMGSVCVCVCVGGGFSLASPHYI